MLKKIQHIYVFLSDSFKKLIRNQIVKNNFTKRRKEGNKDESQILYIDFAYVNRNTLNKKDSDIKYILYNNIHVFGISRWVYEKFTTYFKL